MSQPKIALRIRPLRKWADVAAATHHGARVRNVEHVDLSRSSLNAHWTFDAAKGRLERAEGSADIAQCLKARAGQLGARWHKSAIVATEAMFIASPEFFESDDGEPDRQLALRWSGACLQAWQGLFPGQSVAARLDLDETTPHLSVFFLPLHERRYRTTARALKEPKATQLKVSHNKVFGEAKGPEVLAMLQTWIADEMKTAGFELERGLRVDETGVSHRTPVAGRRAVAAARQLAQQIEEIAREQAALHKSVAEEEISRRWQDIRAQADIARENILAAHTANEAHAAAIQQAWEDLEAERTEVQKSRNDLLEKIQVLDRVMHQVAYELDVQATGSFWARVKAIADALEDRRSGGGPAFRPG